MSQITRIERVFALVGVPLLALFIAVSAAQAASSGVSTQQARTAPPVAIAGSAPSEGSSLAFARADHQHGSAMAQITLGPVAFANLPAAAPNGTITECSDCAATTPCTGSGTGALAQRINGAWVCSSGASGGASRCATDANDLLVYNFNETATPFVSTGSLTATKYNLVAGAAGNAVNATSNSWPAGNLGIFGNGILGRGVLPSMGTATFGAADPAEPAYPVTVSAWVKVDVVVVGGDPYNVFCEAYGTGWATPYSSFCLEVRPDQNNGPALLMSRAGAYTLYGGTAANGAFTTGSWHHIGATYDGANVIVYQDGYVLSTTATTGAIDYGSHQGWYIGTHNGESTTTGQITIDEIRLASVARPQSWFQNCYKMGSGFGN